MDISELNKKIIVQKKESNKALEDIKYIDFKNVWAKIINLHGKERLEAQAINPKVDKKVTIRYIRELDPSININATKDYRVKYKGNYYNILYADNIKEENRFLELMLEVE